MVKLASARESRLYGAWRVRNRWEYINAGLYIFAVILLIGGFGAQLSSAGDAKSGLVVILIGLAIIALVNFHDLVAHMAGVDFRWPLLWSDTQLVLVEFAAPLVQALGSIIMFIGILLLLVQEGRHYNVRLQKHALKLLIAGPTLWVIGSIHDSCQIYERADGHVQILQKGIQIPFLMGSLLFLVGGILNSREHVGPVHHVLELLGWYWVWFGIWGSLLFLVGGLVNVVKVFKMQQRSGVRLEKLRGGAQELLSQAREGHAPLIAEEPPRKVRTVNEGQQARQEPTSSTPYKDVLLAQS